MANLVEPTSFYQDLKNIRMMAIVIGAFVLCWGPFFILKFIEIHNDKCFFLLNGFFHEISRYLIVFILPPLNSVCNPMIYTCFDSKYRGRLNVSSIEFVDKSQTTETKIPDWISGELRIFGNYQMEIM